MQKTVENVDQKLRGVDESEFSKAKFSNLRPLEISNMPAEITDSRKPVIAMGDLHGVDPQSVLRDLIRIKFLDTSFRKDNPDKAVFVQVGDVVDRGKYSLEDYMLMKNLQKIAPEFTVRLLGNHEFFHLVGLPELIKGCKPIAGFREALIRDILEERVLLAWAEGETLYTHAGLDVDFFPEYRGKTPADVALSINKRFIDAINWYLEKVPEGLSNKKLLKMLIEREPLFDLKHGILWARGGIADGEFKQVIGHTPQQDGVIETDNGEITYIDTGRVFAEGGNSKYVDDRDLYANDLTSTEIRRLAEDPD